MTSVSTLGFRGEALSSLCGTATLTIATATAATSPAGTQLTFKPSGECVVGPKIARGRGTTVVVKELFKALPVRRKELTKNAKREFGKAIDLVQAYALIKTATRFEVKNIVKGCVEVERVTLHGWQTYSKIIVSAARLRCTSRWHLIPLFGPTFQACSLPKRSLP